jgi:hypothetical protein
VDGSAEYDFRFRADEKLAVYLAGVARLVLSISGLDVGCALAKRLRERQSSATVELPTEVVVTPQDDARRPRE